MPESFDGILESQFGKDRSKPISKQLEGLCESIANILVLPELANLTPAEEKKLDQLIHERIDEHREKIAAIIREARTQPIDPSLVAEAKQQISDEEAVAILKEFRETASLTFEQLIEGLEPQVAGN
jgi:hypothetical protein